MTIPNHGHPAHDADGPDPWSRAERAILGEPVERIAAGAMLRLCSGVCAAGAMLIAAAWTAGQAVSDRFWWSQFFAWIPASAAVAASGTLGLAAEASRRMMLRACRGVRASTRLTPIIAVVLGAWLVLAGAFAVLDLGAARWFTSGTARDERTFRVVFWNSGAEERGPWANPIIAADPSLCVLASVINDDQVVRISQAMTDDPVNHPVWIFRHDRFIVLSRWRITRAGFLTLAISRGGGLDYRDQGPKRYYDPGRAMFFEVDFASAGAEKEQGSPPHQTRVVWVVDLPSDLSLPRAMVTEQAARAIAAFRGPTLIMDDAGRWVEEARGSAAGFPPPDLLVGDFNIPRGSWSIGTLAGMHHPALEDAWSQAGRWYIATYPRRWPMWHIDQMFVGERFRAVGYSAFSTGTGTHRAVWSDLVPVDGER